MGRGRVDAELDVLTINDEFLTMNEDTNMGLFAEIKVFDLPTETAKKILKDYIEQDTGKKVKEINFSVGNRTIGFCHNEHNEAYLSGIKVVFE